MEEPQENIVEYRLGELEKKVDKILKLLQEHYVSKTEFAPVRNIVYGFVALSMTTLVGSLLALVIR